MEKTNGKAESRKQRIHKIFRIKWQQVPSLFAYSHIAHWQPQLARNCHHHAPLGGPIQLGEHNSNYAGRLGKQARLLHAVLASGGVHHQQGFVRRAGDDALRRSPHLFHLRHQIGLGGEASGRVHDHVVAVAGGGRLQRVVKHGGRIATWFGADHLCSGALPPDLELVNGRSAERIGSTQQYRLAVRTKDLRELSDGSRLSGAIDAHHEDDFGRAVDFLDRAGICCSEDGKQFFFQYSLEFFDVLDLLAVGFVAKLFQDLVSSFGAQVGANERGFQVIEGGAVNLLAERNCFFDALAEILASARDRLFHALEETGFLLFVKAAKKGLDHKIPG